MKRGLLGLHVADEKETKGVFLFALRLARFDLLRAVQGLAPRVTKWSADCDKAHHRLVSYIHSTLHYKQRGFIGGNIADCKLWLFADADHAGEYNSSGTIVGPNTYFPRTAFSKKQAAVAMSSTESEVVSANVSLPFSILDSRSSIFNPRFSILDSRFSILDSRFSILDPRSSILDPRLSILDPRFAILDSRFSILDSRSSILDPRSSILDSRSSILDSRSSILDSLDSRFSILDPRDSRSSILSILDSRSWILDSRFDSRSSFILDPRFSILDSRLSILDRFSVLDSRFSTP
eukprot:s2501_g7.t1